MAGVTDSWNLTIDESQIPDNLKPMFESLLRSLRSRDEEVSTAINQGQNFTLLNVENKAYGLEYMQKNQLNIWVDETVGAERLVFYVTLSDGSTRSASLGLTA